MDDLFIRGFDIQWNEELQDSYVYQIPAIANIDHFEFKSNITFLVGENGSGKSTLLEAFAVACGLNPEGGTANYRFSTYDDYSDLASVIKLRKGVSKPKWSYFLRAESFYNVASALMTKYNDDGKMQDLHARSHGESFLDFIQRADQPGLYIFSAISSNREFDSRTRIILIWELCCEIFLINGIGNYYIEARTRSMGRTDLKCRQFEPVHFIPCI